MSASDDTRSFNDKDFVVFSQQVDTDSFLIGISGVLAQASARFSQITEEEAKTNLRQLQALLRLSYHLSDILLNDLIAPEVERVLFAKNGKPRFN